MRIARVRPDAILPAYATNGAAAMDFFLPKEQPLISIAPGEQAPVPTGWAVEIPRNHAMLLLSRSGHAAKFRVALGNSVGLIDSDYRGEIVALIENRGRTTFIINAGERFAQGIVILTPQYKLEVVDKLTETARASGGFGSTGS